MDRDERVVVVGGSVAGLMTALALGRTGRPVVLLERDEVPLVGDPEVAFGVERRGAPQAHQTHGFLARLTLTLRDRYPDVLDALVDSGSWMIPLTRDLEGDHEGDDDLQVLIVRRTTFEWALRRAAMAEPHVEVRSGVAVASLLGEPAAAGAPARVTGVRLADGTELTAGAVVACTGRRGDLAALLTPLGVDVPEVVHETGHMYLTRWYRYEAEVDLAAQPRLGGDLGYVKFLAIPGDGGTLSATIAVRSTDGELRGALSDEARFDAALRTLPGPKALLDSVGAVPVGPVRPMAGLINRLRTFTAGGAPAVLGFHAVGDAHTCTNPLYGRGCALAVVQATLLADAFTAEPSDATARSLAYEAASAREVEPWYHAAVQMDAYRAPEPGQAPPAGGGGNPLAAVMATGATDPIVGRAMLRVFNLLTRPDQLLTDPVFMGRVAEILADPPPPAPTEGPTRAEMLAAASAA